MGQKTTNDSMPVTFRLDDDVALEVQPLVMELRKMGFKGVSRTFILNSATRYLLQLKRSMGIDEIVELIKPDYKDKIARD